MGKYALVWTTSRGYMPGTNASLNAMEFHGFGADVYVLTGGDCLPAEYRAAWPRVTFVDFYGFMPPGRDGGWYFVYADVQFAIGLLKDYDAVLLWGGDLCVLDNFEEYFEISDKLGAMVLGTNEHGSHYVSDLPVEWPYGHTWAVPWADVPFFVPRKWAPVLSLMLEYNSRPDCRVDRMDGMNYAARDLGARVHETPGELWVQNVPYRYRLEQGRNRTVYLAGSSTRLKSFHRKYWNAQICREYLPGGVSPASEISRDNKMLMNRMYNFFNRECRVKWTESLEVWDGR